MRVNYRLIRRLLGDTHRLFAVSVLIATVQTALLAPLVLLVRSVFDTWIPQKDTEAIVLASLAMLGLFVASGLVGYASRRLAVRVVKQAVAELRRDLLGQLYALPRSWHDRQDSGRLHATIVTDSERVDFVLSQLAGNVVPAALVGIALCGVAAVLNPLLFGLLALSVPVLVLAAKHLGGRSRRLAKEYHDSLIEFSAETQTALRTVTLAKVAGAESWELQRHGHRIEDVTTRSGALARSQATYGIVQNTVGSAAGVLVLAVGGVAITRGALTPGELLSFYAIGGLLIRQLTILGPGVSAAMVALESLKRLDDLRRLRIPDPYTGTRRLDFEGAFALESVSFAYRDEPALDDVDLAVGAGEHLALLGPNGSGKSTLVSLVLGLYRPDAGRVFVDGIAMDELDVPHLRRQIGVVLQDAVLFPGSIADNIGYGRPGAGREEIVAAARAATAAEIVETLPHGYETEVGREGALLSGGEGQRVALARALLGAPALLVLDEPTTFLDDSAVGALLDNLQALPITVVTVTHDPAVAARADRVVHLRDGRVHREEIPQADLAWADR